MEAIFTYILKVNALLLLFYLVYQIALSRETFYKHSRWFLLSGLLVSLVLPFITFTKIEYYEVEQVLSNSIENNVPQMVQISNEVAQEPTLTNQEILFLIYGIICLGFFIKTLFDFFKLFKIIKVSNSEKKDKLVYINTNLVHTPFSFFNYIVFNEELINPVELQNIIKHEEAHSKQKHSFDTLLAQFFIILFWFNPIVWLYRKSIVQNLEFLADSFAIQQVSDKEYYQKTMLKITTQSSNIAIINTFNQSSIKKRIIMLNTNQSNRKNIWKFGIILPFVTAFMLLFQVETIAQEKESKAIKKEIKKDVIVKNEDFESIYNSPYESDTKENLKRVYVINGKVYTKDDLKGKNIAQFNSNVTIDKIGPNDAIKLYGKNAKDGAVIFKGDWKIIDNVIEQVKGEIEIFDKAEITFKDDKTISKFSKSSEIETISEIKKEEKDPLFIVNGKEMRRSEIVHKSVNVDGDIIHYEGESAIEKFGEKGKDGVYVLNGKTTFLDKEELLKPVPQNPEKKYFLLANGDGCVLFNGYMLKIPTYPSINLNESKNKVFIDDKQFHKDMFYNYEHKNLKSVNVLKEFKDDVQVGYSVYFTTK
ncbi:M56 family metallopeptidase [Flavobacterium terrigena]|uniref:Signal transducer regulating beta-lactamase production, contains metallopeptidase domain n=1 Tax=Flavobacterium terrigena TaxID=402734 RepID=A0A1H6UHH8_9FLAO|nr:M56 family metallopeptidase [Flavobacterium terrigena]SEI91156.1 Signal transducer regulating beta-lactamase production, contains metallopeptidase domain [Flavobacterium terrigena]